MARYPAPNPEHVEYAAEEMAKGRSSREIAKEFAELGVNVSHVTVARWAAKKSSPSQQTAGGAAGDVAPDRSKKPGQLKHTRGAAGDTRAAVAGSTPGRSTNPLAAELEARKAAAPPPPPVDTTDTLGTLRGLLESFMAEAHRNQAGNPRLATTLAKSAADVLDQIRKIEHAKREDDSVIRIRREDIARAHAAALERYKALCDRPLHCADCGRKLAIAWGEAADKVAEANRSEGQ